MKVSLNIEPHAGYSYDDIVMLAKAAEDAGFHRFTVSDHFFGWIEGSELSCYEAWTTLALLTPQTERINLGTQVTSQSYRNPALLAKIVANLDNASHGRMDLGIGAGWKASEYEAYGYEFPSSKARILQLREALQIINLLWTEERPSFEGEFYKIKNTMFQPKPVQKPRIPIWVGSRVLKAPMVEETAARYADGLDFESPSPAEFAQKMERMEAMCEKVGRDFHDMKWSIGKVIAVIGEDEDDYEERREASIKEKWAHETITEEMRRKWMEHTCATEIAGPPDVAVERLSQYSGLADVVNLCLPFIGNLRENGLDAIRILKEHVLPKL
jgi:F420-dependent oxidoreductase-like protein